MQMKVISPFLISLPNMGKVDKEGSIHQIRYREVGFFVGSVMNGLNCSGGKCPSYLYNRNGLFGLVFLILFYSGSKLTRYIYIHVTDFFWSIHVIIRLVGLGVFICSASAFDCSNCLYLKYITSWGIQMYTYLWSRTSCEMEKFVSSF